MSDQNETYVRERWEQVDVCLVSDDSPDECIRIMQIGENSGHMDVFDDWLAARQFTEERLEAIREIYAEMFAVDAIIGCYATLITTERDPDAVAKIVHGCCTFQRTFRRLRAALTDLQRGLKPGGKA